MLPRIVLDRTDGSLPVMSIQPDPQSCNHSAVRLALTCVFNVTFCKDAYRHVLPAPVHRARRGPLRAPFEHHLWPATDIEQYPLSVGPSSLFSDWCLRGHECLIVCLVGHFLEVNVRLSVVGNMRGCGHVSPWEIAECNKEIL